MKIKLKKLEQVEGYYTNNITIDRCPYCGHKFYAAGKWNTKKGTRYISHIVYCSNCKQYWRIRVDTVDEDTAKEAGYSIA